MLGEFGVASGLLVGVDASWWGDFDDSVCGHVGGPLAFVEEGVVVVAEQGGVVQVGGSVFGPEVQMVRFAPGWWAVAASPDATTVTDSQSESLVAVEEPFGHAVVEDSGV